MIKISDKTITNPLAILFWNFFILVVFLTDAINVFPPVVDYYKLFGKVVERVIYKKIHYFLNNDNNSLNTNHSASLLI